MEETTKTKTKFTTISGLKIDTLKEFNERKFEYQANTKRRITNDGFLNLLLKYYFNPKTYVRKLK